MHKILVTGGAGYIGSMLVPALLSKGYQVTVIDNFMYHQTSLLDSCINENFRVIKESVLNLKVLEKEISNHDIIIPLAAIVGAPACEINPILSRHVNLETVKKMTGFFSSDQIILFPVTNSGYGIGEKDKFCTEESPLNPISKYGKDKVEAEKILLNSGLATTFRLATVFGMSPRMRIDLLVNDFVYRAVNDRFIVLFEPHFKRNFIHIRDIANAFLFAIEKHQAMKGQTYNLGLSDANLSKLELCKKIQEYLTDFHVFESDIGKDPDKRDYIVSNAKIEKLGWSPKFSLDDGIQELIKGYQIIRNSGQFDNL